ncbi:alpha/beta fold hydrolase [Amycolatopsis tucumanensis]|uniref:Alpha/beta fold hydrolase n=1 Tax=Amycolatopsis tucumanensis TaxID=401106 RepID=A0ABP7JVZ2_9PSEU|nr:alpha/beta hydrolase [Amycolatopsis tucumanensis]MCF6427673.1 alpha/beta hydrolase [Amycolatopsis tucumanensis]
MAISAQLGAPRRTELAAGPIEYRERGTGAPVVFLHGIIANGDVWRHVVPELAGQYRCITPDWPLGSHRLPMRAGTDFTLFGLAKLVNEFLGALGLDDVVLVANDTGGAIAQAVAARHPDRLGRLVLTPCDAIGNFLPPPIKHLQVVGRTPTGLYLLAQGLRSRAVQRLPIAFGRLTERPIPAEIMRSYTEPLRKHSGVRRDFAALVRAISSEFTQEAARGLNAFHRPTLIAWARERRRFFPQEHAHRLACILPNAHLEVLENTGPFISEDQPVALARLIQDFLTVRATA